MPIYQTVAYAFDDTQHGADLFDLKVAGNIYSRIMNPTNGVLEARMAALEGGIGAPAVASGMSAIAYAIQTIAETGDNIVSSATLYGGTYKLFAHTFPQMGIEVRFADARDPASFAKLIDARTKAVYCESVGNPLGNVTDIVVHSLTKYLGGHGTTIGGAIVDSGKFPWAEHKARFKRLNEPDHADHALVKKYMGGKASGIISFGLKAEDGLKAGGKFQDALKLFTRLVNIGDAKSLACHPASTTHRQLNAEELKKAGVSLDMVRLSVGIEHIDDLLEDLEQALAAV